MFHYCGDNVTAVRHGNLKLHYSTARWQTTETPSPKCVECCPYDITALNGTGASLCNCNIENQIVHWPPLIYNMTSDPFEQNILTPDNLPTFWHEVEVITAALEAHYASVAPAADQMHALPDILLDPCCNGDRLFATCLCNDYNPNVVYP